LATETTIVIDSADTGRNATDTVDPVGRGDDSAPAPHPSVTVVIAFFNEERYLPTAIETVRNQSVTDWELVLVDDGSTDSSASIADDAAAADPSRIRVVRHPGRANAGLPASRNLGLAAARSPYLCFLDADDRWARGKLARQLVEMASPRRLVMVCGPSWHESVDGRLPPEMVAVSPRAPHLARRGRFARLMVRGAVRTPPPSDVMYRADALRRVGGVPDGPNMHEDQRTFVAVSLIGPVMVLAEPLTTYTVRADSVYGSHRDDGMQLVRQHREYEDWVTRYCLRHGPYGIAVVVTLLLHRLRRGLARRLNVVVGGLRRDWTAGRRGDS
jgi:glycosyltransferase involved in cell wall biosynthesis